MSFPKQSYLGIAIKSLRVAQAVHNTPERVLQLGPPKVNLRN
jgi:hypothetical protein